MSTTVNTEAKIVASAGTITLGDLIVNRLGFGAMRVAGPDIWGEPSDRTAMCRLLKRAIELGHNFIDTADSYGPGVSESIIAEALYPYPADLIIATKGGLIRPNRYSWVPDGNPAHLRQALDESLKRLRLERIDLYQFHAPDPNVLFEDSIGTLAELQRIGKIRHIGLSNVNVKQLEEARRIVPIVSVQNQYNIENRHSEDVLKTCERAGIAFIPWYPIASGAALWAEKVRNVVKNIDVAPSQVAIAWLLAHSPIMLPIPGTSSIVHLEENAKAAALKLSPEDLEILN